MATQPDNWEAVKALFEGALAEDPANRSSFLEERCPDASLRAEVERLLSEHDQAGTFLSKSPVQHLSSDEGAEPAPGISHQDGVPTVSTNASETTERVIGRYHLVRRIGEGGMGEVWLAEQKEPVRRRVALKLIREGLNTREAMVRFDSERQALALMDHPAIAKVLDAGTTPQGAPYFVMEYVAGIPITDYCDRHKLNTRERLELLAQVCEGVQHAHQKAIIHRDLKPSNILVAEVDGKPVPKIIDFGVAKALAQKLTADTLFTRAGALVGTPEYMSPEQASSAGEDIDTRTDVYSLGIIFYELLAGGPPIELRKIAFEELLRRLREEDPPKPSTKISMQDRATSSEVARKRQTEPRALAKQLRGELDSIALKALEKERARRYASAAEFAADIGRYLNNRTVLAVPPSLAYRARKFARRYRVALATTFAFVLVLTAASVISIRQSIRASREAAVAEAVKNFLQNDVLAQASAFAQAGPNTKPDPDLKVRTALDRAAQRIEGRFTKQPEVEASIRETIGQAYMDLGLYPEARKHLEGALELRRRVLGPEAPETIETAIRLGFVEFDQSSYGEAEILLSQTVERARRVLGPQNSYTLRAMTNLAGVYRREGKYPQAEAMINEAVEIKRRVLGPENPSTLSSMSVQAEVFDEEGKYAQTETLINQILEIRRRVSGPEHPDTLISMNNLANVYDAEGKYAEAEALHRENLDIRRRVLGPEHPFTLSSMSNLANVYEDEGKYAEAEALARQALDIRRRVLGPEHSITLYSLVTLGVVYMDEGKYAQAEELLTQTLQIRRRVLGPEHYETAKAVYYLGCLAAHRGDKNQAIALLNQAVDHGLARRDELEIEKDAHLTSLHGDPRFAALVAHAKEKAAQTN
jgi:tetratricopeptide (TPR) repeat protein